MPKEYIEREALLQRIDDEFDLQYGEIEINPRNFYEMVEDAPAADVVEVVRCGKCRYCDTADCPMNGTLGRCSVDDYCSYGERKDGAE